MNACLAQKSMLASCFNLSFDTYSGLTFPFPHAFPLVLTGWTEHNMPVNQLSQNRLLLKNPILEILPFYLVLEAICWSMYFVSSFSLKPEEHFACFIPSLRNLHLPAGASSLLCQVILQILRRWGMKQSIPFTRCFFEKLAFNSMCCLCAFS